MSRIIALASLYEPLEFLESKIENFNQCDLSDTTVYWSDCSPQKTWAEVEKLITNKCKFSYILDHHAQRQTLYWTWNWIIEKTRTPQVSYFCNTNVDDILHPEYFKKMSSYLDSNQDLMIIGCSWTVAKKKGQVWPPDAPNSQCLTKDIGTLGHFPMWRAVVHDAVGLFNPKMVVIGDSDFWTRIRRRFGENAIGVLSNEYLGCYVSHSNNLYSTGKGPNGESGEAWDRRLMSP